MKTRILVLALVAISFVQAQKNKKPNVIVVLADDIGTGDISYYRKMDTDKIILETPNIDKLADKGVVFTNAHAPASLCATSRYAIMTGNSCYQSRLPWGVWSAYAESAFTPDQLTLGKLMRKSDYNTSFFGKWHLGTSFYQKGSTSEFYVNKPGRKEKAVNVDITKIIAGGPQQNGFDYSYTLPAGIQNPPYAIYENGNWSPLQKNSTIEFLTKEGLAKKNIRITKKDGLGDSNWNPRDMGGLLSHKAVSYIKENSNKEKPFFMYYCSQAVHTPHAPSKELNGVKIAGTTPSAHMDMIKELDVQVGMMVEELKKQGVYENTVFVFTSDNGGILVDKKTAKSGHKVSGIYRGSKNTPYEGGHKVPFIVSWPKELKSNTAKNPILGLDIMATLGAITGYEIEKNQAVDSYNLLPVLKNPKCKEAHSFLMIQGGSNKRGIIIDGDWKLIIQFNKKDKTDKKRKPIALFNLKDNIEEKESGNFVKSPKHKAKVEELFAKYNRYRDSKKPIGKHI